MIAIIKANGEREVHGEGEAREGGDPEVAKASLSTGKGLKTRKE